MALIGVVPSWVEEKKITVNQDYVESVLRAGGTPVLFPVTDDREQISTLLARVDGLLLTGGQDVNPAEYGEQRMPCCGDLSACRDAMEIPLCREALTRRMPVLAICRGMQLLSCVLGGTLYQELPDHPFVLGVQWHPESLSDRYPDHQRLFDAFIHACADHRQPV